MKHHSDYEALSSSYLSFVTFVIMFSFFDSPIFVSDVDFTAELRISLPSPSEPLGLMGK